MSSSVVAFAVGRAAGPPQGVSGRQLQGPQTVLALPRPRHGVNSPAPTYKSSPGSWSSEHVSKEPVGWTVKITCDWGEPPLSCLGEPVEAIKINTTLQQRVQQALDKSVPICDSGEATPDLLLVE